MISQARFSGFLSIWLAKCVVPTWEAVTVGVLLPATRLACGVRISLVPAIIANIQHGLREVAASYLKDSSKPPRARLAYTYLVSWYVLHCPALMTPMPSLDLATPFVESVAACSWITSQRPEIRQLLSRPENYQLYRCPPSFGEIVDYGSFVDLAGMMGLPCWLQGYSPSC